MGVYGVYTWKGSKSVGELPSGGGDSQSKHKKGSYVRFTRTPKALLKRTCTSLSKALRLRLPAFLNTMGKGAGVSEYVMRASESSLRHVIHDLRLGFTSFACNSLSSCRSIFCCSASFPYTS